MSKQDTYLPYEEKGKFGQSQLVITKSKNIAKKLTFKNYQWEIWEDCIMDEIIQQQELASKYPQYVLGIKDWFFIQHQVEVELYIVYDCDQDAKNLYEYLKNINYSIQQKQLYKIFEQLLNLGIIVNQIEHRNIKTGNIIFYKEKVMLTDFGSARTHHLNFDKDFTEKQQKRWQIEGLFYCCEDFVSIIKQDLRDDSCWLKLFENDFNAEKYSKRNDFWGLMIYALQIFSNYNEIDYQIKSIWSINKQNLQVQLMKIKYKAIHTILYDALIDNPTKNYENDSRYYLEKFIGLIQQNDIEIFDFEQQLLTQEDDILKLSKTVNKNKKYYYPKQELQIKEEEMKLKLQLSRQQQPTQEESNSQGDNKLQALVVDSIYDLETHRQNEDGYSVEFMKLDHGAFTNKIQPNEIIQLQDLRKLNPSEMEEYKKELKFQKSQTNSQPIIQKITINLETVEELNRIKQQIEKFIAAPNYDKILTPEDLQQLTVQEREELKQNILRIQSQPQYLEKFKGIFGRQIEIIDELQPQEKLHRFINNPSKENLVNVQTLNEAEVEQKDQFKVQLPNLKKQNQNIDQAITKQLEMVEETDEIQDQLKQIKSDPQKAQHLSISNLTKLSDDQLAEYKKILQQIQNQPNGQQNQILDKLSQVEEIEQKRQQFKNAISNPKSDQVITATSILKLGQDNLDQAIKQLSLIKPEQNQQNQQVSQNLQAAQHAQIISENLQRLKNQPQIGNLLPKGDIKELPEDILEDYKQRIQKINPQKKEEKDLITQNIEFINDIQENQNKLKKFLQDPQQLQQIEKIDLTALNNEDLLKIKQQLDILKEKIPNKQTQAILEKLKKVEDQIKQNIQNQNNIVQQQQQLLINPINLILADSSELNKMQEQLNKNNKQDQKIINKLKDLIKLKQENVPYDQLLKNPLVKELIEIQQQKPGLFQPISPDNIRKEDQIKRQIQQQQLNEQIKPEKLNQVNQMPFGSVPNNQPQQININPQNQSDPLKVPPQFLSQGRLTSLLQKKSELIPQYQQHLEKLIIQHPHLQEIAKKQQNYIKFIIDGKQPKNLKKQNDDILQEFNKNKDLINDKLFDVIESSIMPQISDPRPHSIVQIIDEPERQQLVPKNIRLQPISDQRNSQVRPINDPVRKNIVIDNISQIRERQSILQKNDEDFYNQLGGEFYTVDLDWDVLSNNPLICAFQLKLREINYKLIIPKRFQIDIQDKGRLSESYQHIANGDTYDTKYGGQWQDDIVPHGYGIMMRKKNGSIYQGIFQNRIFVYGFVIELSGKNIQFYTGFYDQIRQLKWDKNCLMLWMKNDKNSFVKVEEHVGPICMNNFMGKGQRKYYKDQQAKIYEIYDGEWKNNKRDGKGILTFGTSRYDGQFQNDLYHGLGRYYYEDELYEDGEYREGKRVGTHTLYKIETVKNIKEIKEQKKIDYSKKFFCF